MYTTILIASFWHYFFGISLTGMALFLILLVLVQRGKGGGLAGAFGGMGGQSAFGTKAGDTFTRITIVVSLLWILMCMASVRLLGNRAGAFGRAESPAANQVSPSTDPTDPELPPATETFPELPGLDPAPIDAPETGSDGSTPLEDSTPADATPADTSAPADTAPPAEDP